jgi:hypothetical protein
VPTDLTPVDGDPFNQGHPGVADGGVTDFGSDDAASWQATPVDGDPFNGGHPGFAGHIAATTDSSHPLTARSLPFAATQPQESIGPRQTTVPEDIEQGVSNLAESYGVPTTGAERLGYTGRLAAEYLPGASQVTSAAQAGRSAAQGDYGSMAMSALGAMPVLPAGLGRAGEMAQDAFPELRIATRIPTAADLKPMAHQTGDGIINMDALSPTQKATNARYVRANMPQVATTPGMSDDEVHQALIGHVKSNLLALHDAVPPEIRDRSQLWYDGAHAVAQGMSDDHGIPVQNAAGTLAAMSPNTAWDQNVAMAQRIASILRDQGDTIMSPEMYDWGRQYAAGKAGTDAETDMLDVLGKHAPFRTSLGTPLSQIDDPWEAAHFVRMYDQVHNPNKDTPLMTPEGGMDGLLRNKDGSPTQAVLGPMDRSANAISAYRATDMPTISAAMSGAHKVRNFYNNIVAPNSDQGDVTIDTHAIAGGLLQPLGGSSDLVSKGLGSSGSKNSITGARGLYGAYADAYRQAAEERGLLPRQMQSITWEALRGLYSPEMKRNPGFAAGINDLWGRHAAGDLSQPEVQQRIIGGLGIKPPRWMTGDATAEEAEE